MTICPGGDNTGGRGSGSGWGHGSSEQVNVTNTTDVWSYRHRKDNEPFVDAINTSVRTVQEEFPDIMDSVSSVVAVELAGSDSMNVLGYYGSDSVLGINTNYTDVDKMNDVYDMAVQQGFHPSRGDKTGVEAVTFHEMGHALTEQAAKKLGLSGIDQAAERIFKAAYRNSGGKGSTRKWAGEISGYAQTNFAETIAEAVADHYCNGADANPRSIAIYNELKKIL